MIRFLKTTILFLRWVTIYPNYTKVSLSNLFKYLKIWNSVICINMTTKECHMIKSPWKYTCLLGRVSWFIRDGYLKEYPIKDGFNIDSEKNYYENYIAKYWFINLKDKRYEKWDSYLFYGEVFDCINSHLLSESRSSQLAKLDI